MDKRDHELFLSSLIGDQVKNEKGESLGKIAELVIDPNNGSVKSVVLSLGDEPGFGNAMSAIPWKALKLSDVRDSNRIDRAGKGDGSAGNSKSSQSEPAHQFSVYTFPVCRSR